MIKASKLTEIQVGFFLIKARISYSGIWWLVHQAKFSDQDSTSF